MTEVAEAGMTLRPSDQAWLVARVIELGRRVEELGSEVERLEGALGVLAERVGWLEGGGRR